MAQKNSPLISWLALLSLLASLIPLPSAASEEDQTPPVVINEVAWAGGSISGLDEWIELYNPSSEDKDLSNWQLAINALEISLPSGSLIPAGGFYLIAKYKDTNTNSVLEVTVDLDREGQQFSIPNSGFTLVLKEPSGEIADSAGDGSPPTVGAKGVSMERKDPLLPGQEKTSWQESTGSINFDEGVPDQGTPKAPNSIPPQPPQINSISPTEATADEIFELEEISGQNFSIEPKPQVELIKGSFVLAAQEIQNVTETLISGVRFDFTGAEAGVYDLIVRNPDGQEGKLVLALTIKEKESFDNADGVIISELLPKPATGANDEFIELKNTLSRPVNLKGWQIDDSEGGSSPFGIENDLLISAFGYLAFYKSETKIALNDTGDIGRIIKPDGSETHRTTNYSSAKTGQAWALFASEFKWTKTPTPGGANTLVVDEEKVELTLEIDEIKSTSLLLNWSLTGGDRIQELSLWQQDSLSGPATKLTDLSLNASSFKIDGLSPATNYYFKLKAALKEGGSKESALVQATTLSEAAETETSSPANFVLSEILPNPKEEEEEFIEVRNNGSEAAELKGYQLKDASGKTFTIGDQISSAALISPGGIVLFTQTLTKIYLNDSGGETLYLISPDGQVISQISYSTKAEEGLSLALGADGNYYWTLKPTPNQANLIITQAMLLAQAEEEEDEGEDTLALPATLPTTGLPFPWLNLIWALAFCLYAQKTEN